jgi:hypothetical protein
LIELQWGSKSISQKTSIIHAKQKENIPVAADTSFVHIFMESERQQKQG